MKLPRLLFLFAITVTIGACQKEPEFNDVPSSATTCRPAKVYVYDDGGTLSDSALYEYVNDRLVKVTLGSDEHSTFTYNGDKVVKRSLFENGSTRPYYYQLYNYNTDGTLAKVESFYEDAGGTGKGDSTLFSYAGGKVSAIKTFLEDPSGTGSLVLRYENLFTYTGNNITNVISKEYMNGSITNEETYQFTYDTKPNYFKKQSPYFLQTDPFFADADYIFFSFALSENNIVKITEVNNSSVSEMSYDTDTNGNVSSFSVDNLPFLNYTYTCK